MYTVRKTNLWDSAALLIAGSGEYLSAAIEVVKSTGFASLLVVTSAGSLAISLEVSDDGTNWYTPEDTDGNDLSIIRAAVTVGSKWVTFPVAIARYMRIKLVLTGANSTVSLDFRHTEEVF